MQVAGYIRCSTEEQSNMGCTMQNQEKKIREYCALFDHELVEIVSDAGLSGKSLKRPALQSILAKLDNNTIQGVVIAKLDRLARSIKDWIYLIENYFTKYSLFSINDKIDTSSPQGRFCLTLTISFFQLERETIGLRTADALKYKRSQGIHTGRQPFGADLQNGKLVENEQEKKIIALALSMREQGSTLQKIADEFSIKGISTKRGGRWFPNTIKKLLDRRVECPMLNQNPTNGVENVKEADAREYLPQSA